MTTEIAEPNPPAATAPASKNVFARIAGVLFSPGETFRDIAARPNVLGPLLIIVLIGYVTTAVIMPLFDYDALMSAQAEQMRKRNPQMSDADMERAAPMIRATTKVMSFAMPVLFILWYVIVAGVLLLAFKIMGGSGTFKQAFSTTLYAWMPLVIFSIIMTLIVAMRGSFDPVTASTIVKSNPGFLVDMKTQPALFALLSAIDVFTIWTLVLLSIGFSEVSNVSRGKAAAIVFSLWIVLILIRVGWTAAFA